MTNILKKINSVKYEELLKDDKVFNSCNTDKDKQLMVQYCEEFSEYSFIEDVVRKQLSSALMLCKMAVPLEDYGAVAFPALRGLEGFIKQVLCKGGLKPADKQNIGEYFEQNKVVGHFALRSDYAAHVGETCTRVLGDSYTLYFNQRHGVFHMDASIEASRILGSLEDAKRIVFEVFESIEVSSKSLCS